MSNQFEISKGVDPVPVFSDIRDGTALARIGDKQYVFHDGLPFTLKEVKLEKYRRPFLCADKALILKHADKAVVTELARLETFRG